MIKEIVEDTVALLVTPTKFLMANFFEANAVIKNIEITDFPLAIYVAPATIDDAWSSASALYATQPVIVAFLNRFAEDNDPTTEQVWDAVIDPMTASSREFWKKIAEDERVKFNPTNVGDISHEVIYSEFDARLFGVLSTATVPYQITQPVC